MLDCVKVPEVMLPRPDVDLQKWAVVACDQYTAQPEYWDAVDRFVADAPSTLRMVYPEAYLLQGGDDRVPAIHAAMRAYLQDGVLAPPPKGFILTQRTTESGTRLGLMLCIDLEAYDFAPGATSLIRPTEGTILDRIPPRVRVRENAVVELPHVMLLVDDPEKTLLEPLAESRAAYAPLYDVELMMGGGHLRGWRVPQSAEAGIYAALEALPSLREKDPVLFAVGDGNHSLATARQCYINRPCEQTRYALVEVVNLYDESLVFEPIHRLLRTTKWAELQSAAKDGGIDLMHGDVREVQPLLDAYIPSEDIDYIHGKQALEALSAREGYVGILLAPIRKETLFPSLRGGRVLPRKAFSMGEAHEKRYYMECRKLV